MAYARSNTNYDNWDPMTENYHDANFNSYERGPGANLTPYARAPANAEYKLYVNNVPMELTETGLRQLFDTHGKTTGVISPQNAGWAFVTYSSFREAEAAIRALDKQPPMHLTVTFARKKEDHSRRLNEVPHSIPHIDPVPVSANSQQVGYISPEQRPQLHRPLVRNLGRGQELVDLARRGFAAPPGPAYNGTEDLLYPAVHDPNVYDPYEDDDHFPATNNMWNRRRIEISSDGTRFVSMGRGCTWYQLPTPHPKVNQQIRAVYENRRAGLYEYGERQFSQQIGKCQNCTQKATMRCQRCREFYCSKACQESDWPRHKIECQLVMPPLEGVPNSGSISMSSGEETGAQQQEPKKRSVRKMRGDPLRRPLKPVVIATAKDPTPSLTTSQEIPQITQGNNEPVIAQENVKRSVSGDQKELPDQNEASNPGGWTPMKNSSDLKPLRNCNDQGKLVIQNQKPDFLNYPPPPIVEHNKEAKQDPSSNDKNSSNRNSTVINQRNDNRQQGGQTNKNFFKRGDRENLHQRNGQPIQEQVKNLNIQDSQPGKPKPLLQDPDVGFYKSTEMSGPSSVKSLPKVSFQEKKTDGAATTRPSPIQTAAKAVKNETKPKQERKSVVELLDNKEEGCFEVHVLLGGKKAAVTICVPKIQEGYTKLFNDLTVECSKPLHSLTYTPKVGDLVCGKRLEDWIRGTVVSLGPPIRLAAIDEGRVEPVTEMKNVPDEYQTLPTLGAICEISEGDVKLEPMSQYTFVVVNNNPGKDISDGIEVVVFNTDDKQSKGFFRPWTPAPEQKGIPYATLTSGTEVCLVSFRNQAVIFARSLVPKEMEIFHRVTQAVARWSTRASPMTEMPIQGEMVVAKYATDENFYRAIVRKIFGDDITISYVDFGNIETTTLENILPISDELKEYPSCVARVILKDVPKDAAMTAEVSLYIGELAGHGTPLMCTFEGSPQDGVILKKADGTVVNDRIRELLTPSWQQPKELQDNTTVFTIEDVEVVELGNVGQEVQVHVLFSYGPLMHAMAPQDQELLTHVIEVMAAQMQAYCEQTKDHYIPRQNELCLAPYEEGWFRAVCLEPKATPTSSSVNYIDFGNMECVEHTKLRVITKDFTTCKSLASICSVVGLGPVNEDGELPPPIAARVMELIPANPLTLIKIVECTKPGEYTIELPEIKKILIEEGLLRNS